MNQFHRNLRLIFYPFLIITACMIGCYTFLHWLFLIKFHAFKIEESIVNVLIPIGLPWLSLLIWFRPKLKLLNLKTRGTSDPVALILFLNWITIALPLIFAQTYLITATGKLTRLDNIAQIAVLPETKYYTVKHYYINKSLVHIKTRFVVSGKYNSDFDMIIYAAIPVFDHVFPDTNLIANILAMANKKTLVILNGKLTNMQRLKKLPADSISRMRYLNPTLVMPVYGDTGKYGGIAVMTKTYKKNETIPNIKISPVVWLGVDYRKTINNHLPISDKQQKFKLFALQCENDFGRKNFDKFVYLDRPPIDKELKNYKDAIATRGDVVDDDPVILMPVFDKFENRNGNKLGWLFSSFGIGSAIFLLILSLVRLKADVSI